jgi:hypothetical protein
MPKGFMITMREVFSRPGAGMKDFMEEMKALTPEDKAWYHAELVKAGYDLEPLTPAA